MGYVSRKKGGRRGGRSPLGVSPPWIAVGKTRLLTPPCDYYPSFHRTSKATTHDFSQNISILTPKPNETQ